MDIMTEAERFQAFATKNIVDGRDDILWGIEIDLLRAVEIIEYARGLDSIDIEVIDHHPVGHLIVNHLRMLWDERAADKLERQWVRVVRKVARRAAYADASEIQAAARKDGTVNYRFDTAMSCPGLMYEILQYEGVELREPVVLNLLNRLPVKVDEKGRETSEQYQIPLSEGENFAQCGYQLYQGKTLWNSNIRRLWDIMERCLPTAIDRGSYHRRLRAPLIPGGYLPALRCRIQQLRVNGRSLEADGSGWYDPEHPDMQPLVAEYGPVVFQFTAIQPETGHLMKGILYPNEQMNCGHREEHRSPIQFDHLQVKGAKKAAHKGLAKTDPIGALNGIFMLDGVHVGIMKAKTTIGRVSGCFETLENIGPNPAHYSKGESNPQYRRDKLRVLSLVSGLTAESVDELGELGPGGLLGRATRDDPHLRRLAEFITLANLQGAGINPLSIPILAAKLNESLSRRMWTPANGAGIVGKYPIVVIDAGLKPGTCVVSGLKPGTTIACWRFPTILAQGLLTLRVVRSQDHHCVNNKITPNCIFMNPHDIITCQQGDDDGDEVGISTDPRVIELFQHKLDRNIFHIEPSSEKLKWMASDREGQKYLRVDPMGPVGKITIMRAALLAVGAYDMARAFSVLIQEAIDSQKNQVRMTSPYKAADLRNWYVDEAGEYHIHFQDPKTGEWLTNNWQSEAVGEFDMDIISEAYESAIKATGCIKVIRSENGGTKIVAGWPLGWRNQAKRVEFEDGKTGEVRIRKAIPLDNWKSWREKQDGEFSNLVHLAHDMAMERWELWHESFQPSEEIPTREVLHQILARLGSPLQPLNISWGDYAKDLRKRAGIEEYGAAMKKARSAATTTDGNINGPVDEQARLARIDNNRANLELQLSQLNAQELLTIWDKELTDCWWYSERARGGRVYCTNRNDIPQGVKSYQANKPNYAFMAVCSSHSAIMRVLGMEASEACGWFTEERLTKYVRWCRAQPDPFHALSVMVRNNTGHEREVHDENGEHVHLAECTECCNRLQTALVRSIRSDKTAKEQAETKKLVSCMNREMQHEVVVGMAVPPEPGIQTQEVLLDDPWS